MKPSVTYYLLLFSDWCKDLDFTQDSNSTTSSKNVQWTFKEKYDFFLGYCYPILFTTDITGIEKNWFWQILNVLAKSYIL